MTDADYTVRIEDIPTTLHSLVRENPDDSYTVILNARMNHETQCAALKHEIEHMRFDDMNSTESADAIELIRHG